MAFFAHGPRQADRTMHVTIRPLALQDIDQVRDIEIEAFTASWPATAFKREIDNPRTTYLVAYEQSEPESTDASSQGPVESEERSGLVDNLKRFLTRSPSHVRTGDEVVGFVGMWFMGAEAHITAIAVREARRGEGIGELLMVGSIREAMRRGCQVVTLEARVSNHVAQSLYEKYGFSNVGIRKNYYTDNREDAVIMTTERVDTPDYQEKFAQLQQGYAKRNGEIQITLT